MQNDPLFVANPKRVCRACLGDETKRDACEHCNGSGKAMVDLNGFWAPSAAFLVCGGPSINKLPHHKLAERGIASLAVNNIAGHVRVAAFVFSDPQNKFHHGMFLDPKLLTFAPLGKMKRRVRAKLPDGTFRGLKMRVQECPGLLGFSRKTVFEAKTFLTTTYAQWGRGGKQPEEDKPFTCLCTMLLGIRLLHYLGCPRVYMLGVDFNMTDEAQYAFGQKCSARNGRYSKENAMLAELKPYFDADGFSLFNCNPESKCDVFPKVSFDDAFEDCKGGVPDEPFDLSEWYNKGIAKEQEKLFPDPISVGKLMRFQKETKRLESSDKVIEEVDAVVTRVSDQTVELRLQNSVIAEFPVSLFTDQSLLKYGQPFKYQIKSSSNGTRYQTFIPCIDDKPNAKRDDVIKMLEGIGENVEGKL